MVASCPPFIYRKKNEGGFLRTAADLTIFIQKAGECSYNIQRYAPNPIMDWNLPYPCLGLALPNNRAVYLFRWLLVTLMKCTNAAWLSRKKSCISNKAKQNLRNERDGKKRQFGRDDFTCMESFFNFFSCGKFWVRNLSYLKSSTVSLAE